LSYATTQTMSTIKESKTLGDVLSSKKKEKKDKDEAKKEKEKEKDKKKEKRKSEMRTSSSTRELSSNSKIDRRKSEKRAVDVRKNINEDDDRDEVSMTEEESVIKGHEFDKKLWPFRRISAYKVKGQKEGFFKRKIGNGRWAPVWLVMYLDYVLWYKPGKVCIRINTIYYDSGNNTTNLLVSLAKSDSLEMENSKFHIIIYANKLLINLYSSKHLPLQTYPSVQSNWNLLTRKPLKTPLIRTICLV
jgi:hypothetical protein